MLRSWACASIVLLSAVVPLGSAARGAVPAERTEPANQVAADHTQQADSTLPDSAGQPYGSEWLSPELLPPPEEVAPSAVDAQPTAATPATDSAVVPAEPFDEPVQITEVDAESAPTRRLFNEFWGYRISAPSLSWTMGDGDQFGNFSIDPNPYLQSGATWGVHAGLGVQFLSGPERTDMPPRVFDISLGCQTRKIIGNLAYDVSFAVLAATDFEGSCRDGIRLPAHAVGYVGLIRGVDLVFGADYLDRADVHVLPVGGLLLRPNPNVRLELAFPRPRVEFQLSPDDRLYFRGGLGGGTWAVERDSQLDDLVSLYQLELAVGLANRQDDGNWGASEFVYLFDRKLEYESGIGDYNVGPTLMLRVVTLH